MPPVRAPRQQERTAKKTLLERLLQPITLAASVIGLISGAVTLWLLWPNFSGMIFGPPLTVTYDYLAVPDTVVNCVATTAEAFKVGDTPVHLLQNQCQADVIAGSARNDIYRAWYLRVKNTGPVIPKVRVVGGRNGSANFNLLPDETALACLGYEGRPGRATMDWSASRLELLTKAGEVGATIELRAPPSADEVKSVATNCGPGAILGYPPL